ncbi:hypothetical protein A9Q96_03015 [Rhodobacterales bacterium 52_120_T64]|nr:hypothetical protein A9Q96_03015 [Rhodobacterales bacterium 52_120_T64]
MKNESAKLSTPARSRAIFLVLYFVTICAVILKGPSFSVPVWDIGNDDAMRLIQVRDLLNGQSWFDVTQYRLGFEAGTPMHWSRLVDLPIAAILWLTSLLLKQEWAEAVTLAIWPLGLIAPTLWAMYHASVRFGGERAGPFGYLFAIIAIVTTPKFEIAALDHHNVQMLLMAFILMAMMHEKNHARDGVIIGVAAAFSVAIGLETLPFIATVSLMVGANWIWSGAETKAKTMRFSGSFAATLLAVFLFTRPDFSTTIFRCDAFGRELLIIGVSGALGLLALAATISEKTRAVRAVGVLFLGGAVVLVAVVFAPQCLGNPYDPIYPDVAREWLGRISESKSLLWVISEGQLKNFGYVVIPIIAILFTIYLISTPVFRLRAIALLLILAGAYAMMFYQIRGLFFLLQLCAIPLAAMMGRVYGHYKDSKSFMAGVLFLSLLFATIPHTWVVGVARFGSSEPETSDGEPLGRFKDCYKPDEWNALTVLPAGLVATSTDLGVYVMLATGHRALAANFHRNQDGIQASIDLMSADMPDAKRLLTEWGVNYVVLCKNDFATKALANRYPDGLWNRLYSGDIPEYLTSVSGEAESLLYIYKTQP